jgi:beta-glucosidase/6-phospho-beta-glucosidase/beta-galactosidase
MTIIPIKDLKDTNKISTMAQTLGEPIFVTKNGYGNMVFMSQEIYNRNFAINYVREKLAEAQAEIDSGVELEDGFVVLERLRKKYGL